MLIIMSIISYGATCSDTPTAQKNCTMVTPPINCHNNYTYQVFDGNKTLVEQGILLPYQSNVSLFYFNFSKKQGDYEIVLCDGTFRQIYVNGDGEVITGSILAIVGVIGILLFIYSKLDQNHKHLKTFILLFVMYLTLVIPRALNVFIADKFSSDLVIYYVWFLRVITIYIIGYFLWSIADYYGKTSGIKNWINDKVGNKGGR